MAKIVLALGGNALGDTPEEQLSLVKNTANSIVDLVEKGHKLVIVHGNGPQVGMINATFEYGASNNDTTPGMPFPECGAMSQGYIGFHLQNAIKNELIKRNRQESVVSIVSQMVVDEGDKAFMNPTKPIGGFVSKEQAVLLEKEKGYTMKEDANRGYRRVVASPRPQEFVEIHTLKTLLDSGEVVIAAGGGGIPVVKTKEGYKGVSAVIDKDFAAAKLAQLINADHFFILTAVDRVAINFGKPNQEELDKINVERALKLSSEGHFAPGSMLPKVEAAIEFVKNNPRAEAIIASLDKAADALAGKTGTVIVYN